MSGIASAVLKPKQSIATAEEDYGINGAWLETSRQIDRLNEILSAMEQKLDSYLAGSPDKPSVGTPSSSKGHSAMGRRNWDTADALRVQVNRLESLLYSLDV